MRLLRYFWALIWGLDLGADFFVESSSALWRVRLPKSCSQFHLFRRVFCARDDMFDFLLLLISDAVPIPRCRSLGRMVKDLTYTSLTNVMRASIRSTINGTPRKNWIVLMINITPCGPRVILSFGSGRQGLVENNTHTLYRTLARDHLRPTLFY